MLFRSELCSSNSTKPIIVGFGAISSTGVTLSFGAGGPSGTLRPFSAARVFLTTQASFACASAPVYRDVQHTFTHELLHAIGLAHTDVAGAMMTPTFFACRSSNDLQPDDLAALAALYPPTQPAPTPTPMTSAALSAPGFSTRITYSTNGQALAVFAGGSLAQLESSAALAGARGVWVQDSSGTFRLLVVNGASFLRDAFAAAFPGGIPSNVAVTLVR